MNNRTGVLIYAFRNVSVDYVKLAVYCASRVKQYWKIPVTIVTDSPLHVDGINTLVLQDSPTEASLRYYSDYKVHAKFLNNTRDQSFELSPYENTIVIDSDFLVSTTQVLDVWSKDKLSLSKTAYMVDGSPLPEDLKALTPNGIPMYWATVLCFDKSKESELFFSLWKKAKRHYKAYSLLYGYSSHLFRNDFCVSVALDLLTHKLGASSLDFTLNYSIPTAPFGSSLTSLDPLCIVSDAVDGQLNLGRSDLHVLDKKPLVELITAYSDSGH